MDYHGEMYVKSLNSINKELKRIKDQKKKLMEQKKKTEGSLYGLMSRYNIESYQGYKRAKLRPKEQAKRKPKSEKRRDAIQLLYSIGVPDPEGLYTELEKTRKN